MLLFMLTISFYRKRLHTGNSLKKTFLSWIAKNRDFLMKNQHFPQNERLRFHKNWFQTKEALSPKKYSVCLVQYFSTDHEYNEVNRKFQKFAILFLK